MTAYALPVPLEWDAARADKQAATPKPRRFRPSIIRKSMQMIRNVVIVTRHPGALQWAKTQDIQISEIIPRVTRLSQIKDRIVIGILPLRHAAHTRLFGNIFLPRMPLHRKGDEFTYEEMLEYGARIQWYEVKSLEEEDIQ